MHSRAEILKAPVIQKIIKNSGISNNCCCSHYPALKLTGDENVNYRTHFA